MASPMYKPRYDNSWALVIGVNDYKHTGRLEYATNDAKGVASVLTERFGFPAENTKLLLDDAATLQGIRSAMHKLAKDATDDDRVFIFYAGHGHTVPAYGRDAGFLVPVDGREDDTATMLPWDDLVHTSRIIRAKHLLFVMDACYGGSIAMRSLAPGSKRFLRDMMGRYSRQFLTAGKANEVVADSGGPRVGHSVFTGHLLDALEGGMPAAEGLMSANAVMAHVYDRVAKDPHSFQAPHYGFLAGDGDFFFAAPVLESDPQKPQPEGDVLVEVPADLIPQAVEDEGEVMPPMLDQVKEYLSDHKHRIQLNDLVMRELRAGQQRLGEENFSVQAGGGISGEDFAARLLKYEEAMSELLDVSALLGRWAEPSQQNIVRQLVYTLAGGIESKSGSTLWLALRSYPMLLTMYVGGIAALEGENYESLKALLATQVKHELGGDTVTVVQATTHAMLDVARSDAFKLLPGHERQYSPQSEYLFKRVQPIVEDILFLGSRYENLFDRFELFYALTNADYDESSWGHPGRFAWKYHSRGGAHNPFTALIEEAKREADNWPPLRVGLFRGSSARFLEVAERFRSELLNKLNWH
ncbi:MAG: caspase family protein [Phycisphaeraceae bacterium]|nr:caspase family protein [Phycisphaeraceae bacterium]